MGIDNHQLSAIHIVTAGGVSQSQLGPVILIFNQYAHHAKGKPIHSLVQLEAFRSKVDDKSIKIGGNQTIKTHDGYVFTLDFNDGLPYLRLGPFTDHEWEKFPHVIMTSDTDRDPTMYDNSISDSDTWYDAVANEPTPH